MKNNIYPQLPSNNECTSCGLCLDVCKKNALNLRYDKNGFYEIDFNKTLCVSCGACEKVCPIINKIEKKIILSHFGLGVKIPTSEWNQLLVVYLPKLQQTF